MLLLLLLLVLLGGLACPAAAARRRSPKLTNDSCVVPFLVLLELSGLWTSSHAAPVLALALFSRSIVSTSPSSRRISSPRLLHSSSNRRWTTKFGEPPPCPYAFSHVAIVRRSTPVRLHASTASVTRGRRRRFRETTPRGSIRGRSYTAGGMQASRARHFGKFDGPRNFPVELDVLRRSHARSEYFHRSQPVTSRHDFANVVGANVGGIFSCEGKPSCDVESVAVRALGDPAW